MRPELLTDICGSFWDSDYFGSTAAHRDNNDVFPNMRQEGLSYSELAHHRRRIAQMIGHLRTRFPAASIMWKPAHLRSKNAHTKGVQWEASVSAIRKLTPRTS